MKRLMPSVVTYFENLPDRLRRRRVLVALFFAAATAFLVAGVGRTNFDTSIEGWFDKDDPTIVAFDWFHHEFGSDDHLYIAYRPRDGDVFSRASLDTLLKLQQELQRKVSDVRPGDGSALKHVVKITSLINAPVLRAEDGALVSKKLVGDSVPAAPQALDKIRRVAESQKSFPLLYFSKDHGYGGILVETDFGAIPVKEAADAPGARQVVTDLKLGDTASPSAPRERPKFQPTTLADYYALMKEVKAVIDKPEYSSHFEYYPVGSSAAAEYNLAMITELGLLNAAALVVIMGLLWFLFRSLSAVVWPVAIFALSTLWTVGITAWLGLPITFFIMVTVMLTLAVGVADTVHVMSAYLSARRQGRDHRTALRTGFRHVAVACLLTTIANIVAVLALSITPIVPIQVFAFTCMLGVGLPFLFSIYLLPLMLDLWAPAVREAGPARALRRMPDVSAAMARRLEKVLPVVEKGPLTVIALFAAVFALCIYGALRTKVDTDPVGSFPKDSGIKRSVTAVDRNMMGAQSMEIFLDLGRENAFHDPLVLREVEKLQRTLERKYPDLVRRTASLADTVKNSYKTLNEDREQMYVIPDERDAVSQTLFLFNQSTPDDRRKLVSDNYDRSRISVRMYNKGSYEYTRAWDAMRADIEESATALKHRYPLATVSITGILPLMMQGSDYLTSNELASFGASIVLVSLALLVLFGSLKAGVIALVPNLIPALLSYGALGLLGRPLDITTMMLAPIIIGIAVDDTVHFVTHYRNEVTLDGDVRRALHSAIVTSGQSIGFTSLILGLGFGTMAFASNAGIANLGIFGALAIAVGLLNDLFLLPAIILVFKPRFRSAAPVRPAMVEPALPPSRLDA